MYALQMQTACQGEGDREPQENPVQNLELEQLQQQIIPQDTSTMNIVTACQNGALNRVTELIEAGADVNQRDSEMITLLHWAAINNKKEIVKYLIDKGAVVDAFGGSLWATPLNWATRHGHLPTIVVLMKAGADPTLKDGEGNSCMVIAAQCGRTHVIAYFVAKGIDPNTPDRNAMTPLMWSVNNNKSLDPTRLLLTLGASHKLTDNIDGSTALHWAIRSKNFTAVKTLVHYGASLDIPNLKNETPMMLLSPYIGAAFLGHKFNQEIKQNQERTKTWCRDKRIKWYCMISTPFILFYAIGMILQSGLDYLIKLFAFVSLYVAIYFANNYVYDERLNSVLPMSTYLATKFWIYVTWLFWLGIYAAWYLWLGIFCGSVPLWICFLKSWRGDPGVIKASHEEKIKCIIELAENGGFSPNMFCLTCLIRKPIRSKHCAMCDVCVARYDHHCPWVNNCIGARNHKYFLGFLASLLGLCLIILIACFQYWQFECWTDLSGTQTVDNYFIAAATCDAWIMWVTANIALHFFWVGTLLACQCYQIMVLGMTTNERINHRRYKHFNKGNPFHRGALQNAADFCDCSLCGLKAKPSTDWLHSYDLKHSVEKLPLLSQKDKYQAPKLNV